MAKTTKKAIKRPHVLSAAAALGGKVSEVTIRMPITNVYMEGDYTGTIYVGSQKTPCNVILDTGSSTLAINGKHFDVSKDKSATITDIAQEVAYGDKSSWIGGVIQTNTVAGVGSQLVTLKQVNVAVAYHATQSMFGKSDGILGLAYTKLNDAFTMPGPTIPPKYGYNEIQTGKKTFVEPYFTQLEEAGLVSNKFAFYTKRSMISMATSKPNTDPLNHGFLIMGGGEESTDLYTGDFQVARVVDDLYYNTNLKSVRVGNGKQIAVSAPTKSSGNVSNSIVDSGTNELLIDQELFSEIENALGASLTDQLRAGYVPMSKLDLNEWPAITFVLEGALGKDVELEVAPETYWQTHTPKAGYAVAVLSGDSGDGGGQSILGLPLMNNYFTIFDRSVNKGRGVVSFAKIK
jgi:hypothetical protein